MHIFNKWIFTPIDYVKRSFYRKMLLSFFMIIIITVLSLGINFYVQTSKDIKKNAISNMERLVDQSVQTMESHMDYTNKETWNLFRDTDLQSLMKDYSKNPEKMSYFTFRLMDLANNNPFIDAIVVRDSNGLSKLSAGAFRYFTNPGQLASFEKESDRLSKIAVQNDGKGAWVLSNTYDPKNQPYRTIAYTQALKDVFGDFQPIIGMLTIQFSNEKLQEWINSLKSNDQGDFYLIDKKDGKIVLGPDQSSTGKPLLNEQNFSEFEKMRPEPYFFINEDKGQTLIVYKSFMNSDWMLVGKVPVNVLLAQVNSVAKRTILIGLSALLSTMLFASFLSSRVLIPIKRLRKGMKQMETGNYNISVPVETKDEIGYFCQSFNQMTHRINHLVVQVYETELLKKDAEIKALQSQMNPHFLYNTLGTIESLAPVQGEGQMISVMCRSLAQMLRYNINGASFSTLGEEIEQLEVYLSIQKIRYETRLEYNIIVDPELTKMRIPKLLFQPIVENSIIHGIERSRKGGTIQIEAVSMDEQDAMIKVTDNGVGMDPDKLKALQLRLNTWSASSYSANNQQTSIGMVNVHARLKLLYGEQYGVAIESVFGEGTQVIIRLMK
ncbi:MULTISPECIES: sensor histidine kinase [unclassified Paenibacillus]|uniref:cache domain-containing sensor histidine kinase n=1 Tax=unclassified Paenibacillus TaxID=185978 RepID=UPI0027876798|nr:MULTISPECIES: sensor histidine kinase [unclassified Paenibacillus]MDQ0897811.1 two-component system sensor histidine kinase YesM [Paenibacillus sp. V4I7]MDQ0916192.1 two-component system sensor histidine kinase YesM [Paenibacillus sp. V4I5]